jgi:transcriptional regulator with XRE-family HTH domain
MTTEMQTPPVGQRIRTLREQRGLSLRALAELSGLSFNAISLIERGENSPTVASLHLLATALGVAITDFFQDEQERAIVFVRADERMRSSANGIDMESLGIGLRNQEMEPFLLTILPGTSNIERPITHAGEEFVYCLQGPIEYCVDDERYLLQTGDSLLFRASLPHCFRNRWQESAQLLMVFNTGEGGHLPRRMHMEVTPGARAPDTIS